MKSKKKKYFNFINRRNIASLTSVLFMLVALFIIDSVFTTVELRGSLMAVTLILYYLWALKKGYISFFTTTVDKPTLASQEEPAHLSKLHEQYSQKEIPSSLLPILGVVRSDPMGRLAVQMTHDLMRNLSSYVLLSQPIENDVAWGSCSYTLLVNRLQNCAEELLESIYSSKDEQIKKKCGEIGSLAAFILDKLNAEEKSFSVKDVAPIMKDKNGTPIYSGDLVFCGSYKFRIKSFLKTNSGWKVYGTHGFFFAKIVVKIESEKELRNFTI